MTNGKGETMFLDGDAEPGAPEGVVSVGSFESPLEAQMAKGMLESAGVESFLVGQNANELLQAAFPVWLQVRAEDEAAARELLAQTSVEQAEDAAGEA
jgi:Putative prokaryotic signal transducing protein